MILYSFIAFFIIKMEVLDVFLSKYLHFLNG